MQPGYKQQTVVALLLGASALVGADNELGMSGATHILNVNSGIIATTRDGYVSFNIDWWKPNDAEYGKKWGNASVTAIDLSKPLMSVAASAFPNSLLRLGGTPQDSVIVSAYLLYFFPISRYGCMVLWWVPV